MNDVVYLNLKDFRETEEDKARRKINISIMLLVAFASMVGLYIDGYFWHSSLLFILSYLAAAMLGMIAAARMQTKNLAALLLSAALISALVEHANVSSGLLKYTGSPDISLFIVTGWMLLMVVILYICDLLRSWFSVLGIFKKLQGWNNLPFIASLVLFATFLIWEGYFAISSKEILAIYIVMAVLGLVYSMKHSIEWNFSLLMASVAIGGYMELVGSLSGFWQYHFQEPLALYIVLSWPINTWAVHGLIYLAGVDIGAYKERCLFRSANSDTLAKQN